MGSDDRAKGAEVGRAAVESSAGAGLVLVSIATGEPLFGAGAALAPLAGAAFERLREARRSAVERMAAVALEGSQLELHEMVDRIIDDPKRRRILQLAVQAAADAALEEKIVALGRLVARGATSESDSELEEAALLVEVLGAIERPHVEVLKYMRGGRAIEFGQISVATGEPLARPAVAALLSLGLLEDRSPHIAVEQRNVEWSDLGTKHPPPVPQLALTLLGKSCLQLLEAVAGADEPDAP